MFIISVLENLPQQDNELAENFQNRDTTNITSRKNKHKKKPKITAKTNNADNSEDNRDENDNTTNDIPKPKQSRKDIIVMGDSMIKGLKGHLMSRRNKVTCYSISKLNMDELVNVARGLCVRKPHVLLVTCGTNSLFPQCFSPSGNGGTPTSDALEPEDVCRRMREFVQTIETEFPGTKVVFSEIIMRTDVEGAAEKINKVNGLIAASNIAHVSHQNIMPEHLNGSNLHLNNKGDRLLATNIIGFLRDFLD